MLFSKFVCADFENATLAARPQNVSRTPTARAMSERVAPAVLSQRTDRERPPEPRSESPAPNRA